MYRKCWKYCFKSYVFKIFVRISAPSPQYSYFALFYFELIAICRCLSVSEVAIYVMCGTPCFKAQHSYHKVLIWKCKLRRICYREGTHFIELNVTCRWVTSRRKPLSNSSRGAYILEKERYSPRSQRSFDYNLKWYWKYWTTLEQVPIRVDLSYNARC